MKTPTSQGTEKRRFHHLRVPVFEDEQQAIKAQAEKCGMSVAQFLRELGQGCQSPGVQTLRRHFEFRDVTAELKRLTGLLDVIATGQIPSVRLDEQVILNLLDQIAQNQKRLNVVIDQIFSD